MAFVKQSTFKSTPALKQLIYYRDFPIEFRSIDSSGDIETTENADAIKGAIKNLLLTDRGERFFNPLLGSDIRKLLFENATPMTQDLLIQFIKDTISQYEPRAQVLDVIVSEDIDNHRYAVTLTFSVINKREPISLSLLLGKQ